MKTFLLPVLAIVFFFMPIDGVKPANAASCSESYGFMATEDFLTGKCKCMSGYVFGKDFMGRTTCVSGSSVCSDKYGVFSNYDSLSGSCECSYGYSLHNQYGSLQCVSNDTICRDDLGIGARYDSLSGGCKCGYGDVISNGRCTSGDQVCRNKHGLYSSYEDYSNSCKCDAGYTLNDSNQCVKKQNNVYFKLLDVDTYNKRAIIKSEYDGSKYLITYNSGCYSFSMERYVNRNLVVNLGTDFYLDTWDKIVLQDDDEVCDITYKELTYEDSLTPDEEEVLPLYFKPAPVQMTRTEYQARYGAQPPATATAKSVDFPVPESDIEALAQKGILNANASFRRCPSTECSLIRYYAEGSELSVIGKYKLDDWYEIDGTTDAGGTGDKAIGWIHSSLFKNLSEKEDLTASDTVSETPKTNGVLRRAWNGFLSWFK